MKETFENLKKLSQFGISEGISELILTTKNEADSKIKANAAPFGINWKNDKMFLHLFKGSKTYENLIKENYFAANMTDDAVLYAMSAFYDLEEDEFFFTDIVLNEKDEGQDKKEKAIAKEDSISVPILKNAKKATVFKCVSRTENIDSMIIHIEPVDFITLNDENEGVIVNRGFHSVIEVCIHLTRYELTKDPIYIDYIRHHQTIIQRCGRKNDKKAFSVLKKRLLEIEIENRRE